MTRPLFKAALALAAAFALLGFAPTPAGAHAGDQSYLYLDVTDEELGGRVEMPYIDLREVFGWELDDSDDDAVLAELRANADELWAYVSDHVSIGADGRTWDLEFTDVTLLGAEGGYAVVGFVADVPGDSVPRTLEIGFDPFFDEIDDRDALLLIGNDWQAGVIDNGEEVLIGFYPDTRERVIDLGDTSQWSNFTASIELGVTHIRTGPDHILFVLVLLLPSVLVFTTAWHPVATFGGSLWRVLKVVTMFTVAHSITFVLAGLELLPLPSSRVVESVIAASIAVAALHNLRPVAVNREWAIAFVFGLFHGMGFASLVSELDVGRTTKLVSLLGRNLGIEIGQVVVVCLVFPALFLLRRTRLYRPIFVLGSLALTAIAVGWMLERIFDLELRVARLVDPIVDWPRSVLLIGALTALAAAVHFVEARADRLLPTVERHATDELVLSGSSGGPP